MALQKAFKYHATQKHKNGTEEMVRLLLQDVNMNRQIRTEQKKSTLNECAHILNKKPSEMKCKRRDENPMRKLEYHHNFNCISSGCVCGAQALILRFLFISQHTLCSLPPMMRTLRCITTGTLQNRQRTKKESNDT